MKIINKINRLNEIIEYKYGLFAELTDKVLLKDGDSKYYQNIKDNLFKEILQLQSELFELEEQL